MKENKVNYWKKISILFGIGFLGVLSSLPMVQKLILLSGQEIPLPMPVLLVVSSIQSAALVFAMIFLGAWISPKVNLNTPFIDACLNNKLKTFNYRKVLLSAVLGGVAGGLLLLAIYSLFLHYLPREFVENAKEFSPPIYTRLLYGGITEEILIRFGLMSFFVWGIYRISQKAGTSVKAYNYIMAIVITSLLFGIGHLPAANLLSPIVSVPLVVYIIVGNSVFGLVAGFLYWKRGLEAAMVSHMLAHLVMIAGDKIP